MTERDESYSLPRFAKTIGVLVESSRGSGRAILGGITAYAGKVGWRVLHREPWGGEELLHWLKSAAIDGLLSRLEHPQVRYLECLSDKPIVDLRGHVQRAEVPVVRLNEVEVIRLAWDHLHAIGMLNIAFCGYGGLDYSATRLQAYRDRAAENNLPTLEYSSPPVSDNLPANAVEAYASLHDVGLTRWLQQLPRPVGIIACNDMRGRQVLDSCHAIDARIPADIAVVGVDDDEVYCNMGKPSLSSVIPSFAVMGSTAAQVLHELMDARNPHILRYNIQPIVIAARASTNTVNVADTCVAVALRFIEAHDGQNLQTEDVLNHLTDRGHNISRGTLDRKFSAALGRTVKEQLTYVKIEKVKRLLRETDNSIAEIALSVGIEHPEQILVQFKRVTGETPGQYRRLHHAACQPGKRKPSVDS